MLVACKQMNCHIAHVTVGNLERIASSLVEELFPLILVGSMLPHRGTRYPIVTTCSSPSEQPLVILLATLQSKALL